MFINLLQPGAGTIRPDIISSLMTGGSDGGGGHTSESIMSSVTRIIPTVSGGSVRDELRDKRMGSGYLMCIKWALSSADYFSN